MEECIPDCATDLSKRAATGDIRPLEAPRKIKQYVVYLLHKSSSNFLESAK